MNLELKDLAGYLPYKLPIKIRQEEQVSREEWKWFEYDNFLNGVFIERDLKNITPILHPLSDLTKEIEVNGEKFVPLYVLQRLDKSFIADFVEVFGVEECKFSVVEKLHEWHFDIHGLIAAGLAIEINTLK